MINAYGRDTHVKTELGVIAQLIVSRGKLKMNLLLEMNKLQENYETGNNVCVPGATVASSLENVDRIYVFWRNKSL